jgi:hypothetical protein
LVTVEPEQQVQPFVVQMVATLYLPVLPQPVVAVAVVVVTALFIAEHREVPVVVVQG